MLPAEHKPMTTRKWYKVLWLDGKFKDRIDLLIDEDKEKHSQSLRVLEEARVKTCTTGPALGFGKLSEKEIDSWMKINRV